MSSAIAVLLPGRDTGLAWHPCLAETTAGFHNVIELPGRIPQSPIHIFLALVFVMSLPRDRPSWTAGNAETAPPFKEIETVAPWVGITPRGWGNDLFRNYTAAAMGNSHYGD